MGSRIFAVIVCVLGCGSDAHHSMSSIDAMGPDAPSGNCIAAAGTASVTLDGSGPASSYNRLYAGGVWQTGPVAVTQPPIALHLLFASVSPVPGDVAGCCLSTVDSCCQLDSVTATVDLLAFGAEVGVHPATFARRSAPSFSIAGMLKISAFDHPFLDAPGRIAGSVSASANGIQLDGMFDNSFCSLLLSATI